MSQEPQAARAWPRPVQLTDQAAWDIYAYLSYRSEDEFLSEDAQARAGELAAILQAARDRARALSHLPPAEPERALVKARECIVDFCINHPHLTDTEFLDEAEGILTALTQPTPSAQGSMENPIDPQLTPEQEGIEAGLNGCVSTHNPYLLREGMEARRDAWERGNARVRAVYDNGYAQGRQVAELAQPHKVPQVEP